MPRRISYGLFRDAASSQRAFEALVRAGIRKEDIVVLSSEPHEAHSFFHRDQKSVMPWLAALGGLVGGVGGYLLASFTQRSYPLLSGGMPIVTQWTDAIITYETTMLGAILATVLTLVWTARLGSYSGLYDPEISEGMILLGAPVSPEQEAQLERLLREAGAEKVKQGVSEDHA